VRFSSTFHFEGEQGARDRTNTFRLSLSWRIGKVHEGSHPASQLHDSRARCCETVLLNPAISATPSTIGHQEAPTPPRHRRHRRRVADRAPARLASMFGGRSVPLRAHAAQRGRAPPLDPRPAQTAIGRRSLCSRPASMARPPGRLRGLKSASSLAVDGQGAIRLACTALANILLRRSPFCDCEIARLCVPPLRPAAAARLRRFGPREKYP